jgi:pterin-4a-carbinolamine dehydratase
MPMGESQSNLEKCGDAAAAAEAAEHRPEAANSFKSVRASEA